MDITEHNRRAWNRESAEGSEWCRPVDDATIRRAREGHWSVVLTPNRPVPAHWFGELADTRVLCLASGGGQQAPVLAAAGAAVVSFDLSDEQLAKDHELAERHGLSLRCVQGDMSDLSLFDDAYFDLIFHPVANVFIPDLEPLWRGCYRVMKPGGALLAGFMNPGYFLFDHDNVEGKGPLTVTYALPYAEPGSLGPKSRQDWEAKGYAAQFSHSLESQIGGQLAAGFTLTDLYEDDWSDEATPLNAYAPTAIATRAVKPGTRDRRG